MSPGTIKLALAAGVLVIFAAGVFVGTHIVGPEASGAAEPGSAGSDKTQSAASSSATGRSSPAAPHPSAAATSIDPADEPILKRIREARMLPAGERTPTLLKALEETTRRPLSRVILEEFRSLVKEGEVDSSHYILSLMEQREERASVDFLLEAATHQDPDIADRALFALEAVAGTVFKNREAAVAWAETWKPDPDRAKLFSPGQGSDHDGNSASPPRQRGPGGMGVEPEPSTRSPQPAQ